MCSELRVAEKLSELRCQHPKGFRHAPVEGSNTKGIGFYPIQLCRTLLGATFCDFRHCPALPTIAGTEQSEHREKEPDAYIFGVPCWSVVDPFSPDAMQALVRVAEDSCIPAEPPPQDEVLETTGDREKCEASCAACFWSRYQSIDTPRDP